MKALSLWQPWATVWVLGYKQHETRSWATAHRGPTAVHAAKTPPSAIPGLLDLIRGDWMYWSMALRGHCPVDEERRIIGLGGLPRGAILGVVNISGCEPTDTLERKIYNRERAFGDYTPGRFGWLTDSRTKLLEPIPYRGRQQLFEVPDDVILPAWEKARAVTPFPCAGCGDQVSFVGAIWLPGAPAKPYCSQRCYEGRTDR